MANVVKKIIGSFEDIGESVVQEAAKVPADITGKALESLGVKSGSQKQAKSASQPVSGQPEQKASPDGWDNIDRTHDQQVKQAVARQALAALAGRGKPKEPSVWERLQQEAEQKKDRKDLEAEAAKKAQLPSTGHKPKRGNLYGIKAKRASGEIGKNVKTD